MTTETAAPQPQKLENVMGWLANVDAATPAPADPEIDKQANAVVSNLLSTQPADGNTISHNRQVLESMGAELQKEAARRSQMLKQPISKLYKETNEGGEVANALVNLKLKVEELDPGQFDFEPGWLTRSMGMLPFVGTPLKRYFTKYENASTVMDAIIRSLRQGREQLSRDNMTLADDQKAMRALTLKLERAIKLARLIDQKLSDALSVEIAADDPRHKFISEELLFPLRQRIQDLQQQMLVNQQGYLTTELVIRNNKELIRGVNRANNVTVNALQVAVTLALALANQKIVLEKIEAMTKTTEGLIAGTAERLKTQGVEIHKRASSTQLDMEVLKKAFDDIRLALDDIARYRQEALPKMAQSIIEMDELAVRSEEEIRKFEKAAKVSQDFSINIVE